MRVTDLTGTYQKQLVTTNDRQAHEASFPELFDHYYRFWASREREVARCNEAALEARKSWISRHLERLQATLAKYGLDLDSIEILYMVGVGTSNGHAFRFDDRMIVWLPLETYTSEKLVEIFVTHEVIHALHYLHSPEFYFETEEDKLRLSRQLITEGVATYLTKVLLNVSDAEALWADYQCEQDSKKWIAACEKEDTNLLRLIAANFYLPGDELGIFYANDPDDIYNYRSGYYAGLRLIEELVAKKRLSPGKLLKLSRGEFEADIMKLIEESLS